MKLSFLLALVVFVFSASQCNPEAESEQRKKEFESKSPEKQKEILIEANKRFSEQEDLMIEQYISRRKVNFNKTGRGLRYIIHNPNSNPRAQSGEYAKIEYTIKLLNGYTCYSSVNKKPEVFLIERDNVESGLHEGIQLMGVGEKATFIIPSHLAHGLLGDRNKIPPRATLIFDINLIALK